MEVWMQHDMKKKSRLGRGLSSLMGMNAAGEGASVDYSALPVHQATPSSPEPAITAGDSSVRAPRGTPLEVSLELIDPNPNQPRRAFTEAALSELADSIRSNGIIQPVVLKIAGDRYQLIAGERRLRASKLAGLKTIPAIVKDADELAQAQMALVENIQREDLNPLDRAAGYQTLISELGVSQTELATRLGEDRATITNHLRLLELDEEVQTLLRDALLTLGHAKVLCGVQDPAEQRRLAALVVSQHLSVRHLERLIASPPAVQTAEPSKIAPSAHLKDLEVNLSKQLGLRVQVRTGATKSKGKLIVHYATLDEFDQLIERMGVRLDD
jgi:ParB family chromosome partitioning protein